MKKNLIAEKSFEFAVLSTPLYCQLISKNEFVLSKQFYRCATSVGANVEEAQAGYSRRDFAAKMSIASKEARETLYWIRLLEATNFIDFDFQPLKTECQSMVRILTAIVKSVQNNDQFNG